MIFGDSGLALRVEGIWIVVLWSMAVILNSEKIR